MVSEHSEDTCARSQRGEVARDIFRRNKGATLNALNNQITEDNNNVRFRGVRAGDDLTNFGQTVEWGSHVQVGKYRDAKRPGGCPFHRDTFFIQPQTCGFPPESPNRQQSNQARYREDKISRQFSRLVGRHFAANCANSAKARAIRAIRG